MHENEYMENECLQILRIFGSNVQKYRLRMGISQEKLADLCGLHRTYISDIERCNRNVSLKSVEKISEALGVAVPELFIEEKV